MALQFNFSNMAGVGCSPTNCLDETGCPADICPDFAIRRHDTKPPLKVSVADCDGPLDVQGLVVEVNMWANAKLRAAITAEDTYFRLADDIGFEQAMVGDIIIMDRARLPEYMLVTNFDEENKLIQVERGYRSTVPSKWKRGTPLKIFRVLNAPAETELVFEDIQHLDGTVEAGVLTEAYLVYEWNPEDTCLAGCFWLEFKLLKMQGLVLYLPGGQWTGEIHEYDDGFMYTGSSHTESSVRLSYDNILDIYQIPSSVWTGDSLLHSGDYYTGLVLNDGSVVLNRTDKPSGYEVEYDSVDESELESESFALGLTSVIPSFIPSEILDPETLDTTFGCTLGAGVEWVRRIPIEGEGFLIKIERTLTRELP